MLHRDLKIESPYNTYLNYGLPYNLQISEESSIVAALYPENDFIFFVATGGGYHTFTTNERDHNQARKKLQRMRKELRKSEKIYEFKSLNSTQRSAVEEVNGPVLIFAGAGSGKTRVLTHKMYHLIKEEYYKPENILSVTFTNKAAREMKNRVLKLLKLMI